MKKLYLTLLLTVFSAECHALNIINGGSSTPYATCSMAKPIDYLRARSKVNVFLKSYKKTTIENNLSQIRLCGKLTLWGQSWAAGTYDLEKKIIYVLADDNSQQEYILHHEFSSILLKKSSFEQYIKNKFIKYSKKRYGHTGKAKWMEEQVKYLKPGFIVPYAKTCFENDFNMIAAYHKTPYLKKRMSGLLKHPLIYKKHNIVKKFYESL